MTIETKDNSRIASVRMQISNGSLSVADHCDTILSRANSLNSELGAYSQILKQSAKHEAASIEDELSSSSIKKPLAGITIAVKDNIDTVPATCPAGLDLFKDYIPERDSKIAATLRSAGAVIVGVTNTDSGGFGVTTPSVVNPRFPNRIAGGSSGGSAAAVAAKMCDAAIGTDTGGSIRIPAACCGIYGFKPTYDRVSLDGIRPLSNSYDHVGPLASSVDDIIEIMRVVDTNFQSSKTDDIKSNPVVGLPRYFFEDASDEVVKMTESFLDDAMKKGLKFRYVSMPFPDGILFYHIKLSMKEAFDEYAHLKNEEFETLPAVAQKSLKIGASVSMPDNHRYYHRQKFYNSDINNLFMKCDFMLMPTLPVLPPNINPESILVRNQTMDVLEALIRYTAAFNQTGHPVLAFPIQSKSVDVPGSLQLIGPRNSDADLLHFARHYGF